MGFPISVYNTRNGVAGTDSNAPIRVGVTNPTGTVYSDMWTGYNGDGYALTLFTTGTLTGTFTQWITDKPFPSTADDSDWVQDTNFSPTNPAGSAVKFRDDAGNSKGFYKRLKYVHGSGTGTIQAFVTLPKTAS